MNCVVLVDDTTSRWACDLTMMRQHICDPIKDMYRENPQGIKRGNVRRLGKERKCVDQMITEISDVSPQERGSIETTHGNMLDNPIPRHSHNSKMCKRDLMGMGKVVPVQMKWQLTTQVSRDMPI